MKKNLLKFSRYIISRMPKGKSMAIRLAIFLFGTTFNDIITAKDGRKFYIGNISLVKRQLFFVNEYEDYETKLIQKIVKQGEYALDVGASYGWYTTLLSTLVGSGGRVFAFELAPNIAEECVQNIRLNHMEGNTTVESIALGEKEESVSYIYSEDLGLGNLNPHGLTGGGILKTGTGKVIPLDTYAEQHHIPKIDFIKCDVDGAEVLFLKGARKTISNFHPTIIIEASGAHGRSSSQELFQELQQLGYSFFSLHYKTRLEAIEEHAFGSNFKENILCLSSNKLSLLKSLT